jgi:acyl carrier protein
MNPDETRHAVREQIQQLAKALGTSASDLKDDQFIPQADILDSAATMELIVWLEGAYNISISDDDLVIENFGTINLIVEYLQSHA